MTEKEMLAWILYWEEEDKKPKPSEWYLMQIASEVDALRCALLKSNYTKSLKDYILKWAKPQEKKKLSPDEATRVMKSIWSARIGQKIK